MLVTVIFKIFFVSQKWTRMPFKVWEIFLELYIRVVQKWLEKFFFGKVVLPVVKTMLHCKKTTRAKFFF